MAQRSLRDQMLAGGSVARRRKKKSRTGVWVTVAVVAALLVTVVTIGALQAGAGAEDAVPPPTADGHPADTQSIEVQPVETNSAPEDDASAPGGDDATASSPAVPAAAADTLEQLTSLTVVSGVSSLKYDRGLFGQTWFDEDRNGCDTRNDMLGRDLRDVVTKSDTNGCKVLSGTLDDWYSGETVDFVSGQDSSRLVQIDHMVPLAWAWRHGADNWSDEKRRAFANDPLNLVATTDVMNTSKSDSGPGRWLPANDAALCRYVQQFTFVLHEYDLGIGLRDRAMVQGIMAECATSAVFGELVELP